MTSASGSSGATLYGQRLQAFAHHLQLPDPAQLIDEGLLRVGATNVRLHFDPELDGNAIWLRLDLGEQNPDGTPFYRTADFNFVK